MSAELPSARAPGALPRVSVVIPTHNRLGLLCEAIESVRAQTYQRLELIVVDDGSTDGTGEFLRAQPDLMHVPLTTRGGPSRARNRGTAVAEGELIAFLDSDDLFVPHKLSAQVALMQADPELGLCHTNERWLRGGKELRQLAKHEKRGGLIYEHCLPLCRISPSAVMLRRQLLLDAGGFDESLEVAEDYELWLRLTCRHRVGFIDEPLSIKRGGHGDQLSMKYGQIEVFRIRALLRVLERAPLSPAQRAATRATLARKCEIYARGCEKRGKHDEAAHYRSLGSSS